MAAARKDDSKPANQPIPAGDEVAAEVQRATDQAQAQGFFGVETDPTPNEHYTVAGVTEGLPTPETDKGAAAEARRAAGLA
ncbi:hypothetical protein ACIQMY_25215 [Streptomyces sp. NPDC091368]|uniref:hypothetical protein n=1 Tax=Streptomyces sp. NPDC091368 TaxID=3365993 RepID=UPI0037FE3E49